MQFHVIDADGHVTEPPDRLASYLESDRFRKRRPLFPADGWDRSLGGTLGTTANNAQVWLDLMDAHGLESVILYPTLGLGVGWIREPDYAVEVCRAYNNFLYEEFRRVSPRLMAVALIPLQDVPEAVKEVRRAMTEQHCVGAFLPAVGLRLPLGYPSFRPIYAEAERLGVMVAVHATVRGAHFFAADGYDSFVEIHTMSHPVAQMMHLTSMIFQGVPEEFPRLRIAYMESGCSWVPYWLDRMDGEYGKRGKVEAPILKKLPSEYVKSGNIFFHAEDDETLMPEAARVLGDDVLFYASDFPHWDHNFPESMHALAEREDLSAELRQKILYLNAKRLYGLTG